MVPLWLGRKKPVDLYDSLEDMEEETGSRLDASCLLFSFAYHFISIS